MESILTSTKKALGITEEDTSFDPEIIMYINTVFSALAQIGVGPSSGYSITNEDDKWSDVIPSEANLESIKTYTYIKVRLIFDPPQNSSVAEALNKIATELEWRIYMEVERIGEEET